MAGFAAIDTEYFSIHAFVLLSNCKSLFTLHSCQGSSELQERCLRESHKVGEGGSEQGVAFRLHSVEQLPFLYTVIAQESMYKLTQQEAVPSNADGARRSVRKSHLVRKPLPTLPYNVSFKLKAVECTEKTAKEATATLYTWWPLTTLSFTIELVTCES